MTIRKKYAAAMIAATAFLTPLAQTCPPIPVVGCAAQVSAPKAEGRP